MSVVWSDISLVFKVQMYKTYFILGGTAPFKYTCTRPFHTVCQLNNYMHKTTEETTLKQFPRPIGKSLKNKDELSRNGNLVYSKRANAHLILSFRTKIKTSTVHFTFVHIMLKNVAPMLPSVGFYFTFIFLFIAYYYNDTYYNLLRVVNVWLTSRKREPSQDH